MILEDLLVQPVSHSRRLAVALALVLALVTPAALVTAHGLGERADAADGPRTRVVLRFTGCEGCSVSLHSRLDVPGRSRDTSYDGRARTVRGGRVVFAMPTLLTEGLSIAVVAPFEGATQAISEVVVRYRGQDPGDVVDAATATTSTRGSVCFAGTDERRLRIDVAVAPVQVPGNPDGHQVTAAAAWATTTQPSLRPLLRAVSGYVGSQDVPVCRLAG